MGADAKAVDTYAKLFGVSPDTVRSALDSGAMAPAPMAPAAMGPAPGDAGFASQYLGGGGSAPMPKAPAGPAPGDPGFGLAQVGGMGSPQPAASPPTLKLPPGAGQIDTSGVAPKGFSSGAVHINAPPGAGQIDLSGVTPPRAGGAAAPAAQAGPSQAQASPGVYVPGGWQHSSRGEQRQQGMDPAKLEEGRYLRDVASGHGLLAADKRLEGEAMQGAADAVYAQAHEDAAKQALAESQRIENERKAYIAREHEKLADLNLQAQKQIDPEAAKGPIGAQIFAALGVALGAFGASLNGGANTALQIVQANIDRNIKAQEANIANAGKARDREQSLYRENLDAFGDRDRAVLATKMQMLDQAKAAADQMYAKSKGTMDESQYHATIQGLNEARASAADQFAAKTDDKVTTEGHDAYRPGGMVGGAGAATGEAKKDAHGYSEDLEKAGLPAIISSLEDVDQRIDTMGKGDVPGIGYIKDKLPAVMLSDEGVANRQTVQSIKNNIGHAKFGGALSPTEADKLDRELEGAHDANSLRRVVQSLRRATSNRQRNIAGGYSPEGRALYERRGGSVRDVRQDKATTPYQRPVEDDGK